ncbi:MAG: transposase [Actinobacteria bacterium]|nr:transposase [Actinomycetota bacterium]
MTVLPGYKGTAVHDRLAMYFNYTGARHGVCGAHLIRNLASVAVVWNQTEWAEAMIASLIEMKCAAEDARAAGRKRLGAKVFASFLARYDRIVELGQDGQSLPDLAQAGLRGEGVLQPRLCATRPETRGHALREGPPCSVLQQPSRV